MKFTTQQAINSINRSFYSSDAAFEFSQTREAPWVGWHRILSALPRDDGVPNILDVGCGNGRFAVFLAQHWDRPLHYLGVDISEPLLKLSNERGLDPACFEFSSYDVTLPVFKGFLGERAFSLIALYGVLHHIPGFDVRRDLIASLLHRLRRGGRLALSFWQFGAYPRFRRKIVSWNRYNLSASKNIEVDDLEEGDYLLAWGDKGDKVRYCHYSDQKEIETLVKSLDVRCIDDFRADGKDNRLNRYLLLGRNSV